MEEYNMQLACLLATAGALLSGLVAYKTADIGLADNGFDHLEELWKKKSR